MEQKAIEMYRSHNTHIFNAEKRFRKKDIDVDFTKKSTLFNSTEDGICILDKELNIINVNFTLKSWYAHKSNFIGKKCYRVYHDRNKPCDNCPIIKTLQYGKANRDIISYSINNDKAHGWHELQSFPIYDGEDMFGVAEYVRDITYEVDLYSKISEISHQMDNFKEQNELLKMYLSQTKSEKEQIKSDITSNIQKYVKPLIKQVKESCEQRPVEYDLISFLETLLQNIVTPYLNDAGVLMDFTSREIQTMSLIKGGKTTKEIAEIMYLSTKTIDFHRSNIRKKLNLERGKGNLRSYLISSRLPLE